MSIEPSEHADGAVRLTGRERSGVWVAVAPSGLGHVIARGTGAVRVFEHAAADVDAVTVTEPDQFEDIRVLWSSRANHTIDYTLECGPSVADVRLRDGRIEVVDREGQVALRTEPLFAVDALGRNVPLAVSLTGDRHAARLRIVVDPEVAGERFPVTVDPIWTATTSALRPRVSHTATLLSDGRVLVVGSNDPVGEYRPELFDPKTNTWAYAATTSNRQRHSANQLLGGNVLVAGGYSGGGPLTTAALYNPTTNTWTTAGSLNQAHSDHASAPLPDGRILVVGGTVGTSSAEAFDPATNTWKLVSPPTAAHSVVSATALPSGRVFVVGGSTAEIYDPSTDTWTPTASSPLAVRSNFAASVLLPGGKVFVTGGTGTSAFYDPTGNTWTSVGTPPPAMWNAFSTTLLSTGKVLLAGGVAGSTYGINAACLFDPLAASWSLTDPMLTARMGHSATRLSSGLVLVLGGNVTTALSSAELFKPADSPLGTACTASGECASGFCVDGVCCDTACTGTCVACAAAKKAAGADGVCGSASAGTDPHDSCSDDGSPACTKNGLCDGTGACAKYPATGCSPRSCISDRECTSGFCVDGICCDKKCDGACEACTAKKKGSGVDGLCGFVAAGSDPRDRCAVDGGYPLSCRADGQCDGAGSCRAFALAGTVCGAPTCAGGVEKTPTCDGAGVCNLANVACEPFACAADGSVCAKTCKTDGDCNSNAFCDVDTCKAKKTNGQTAIAGRECVSGIVADGVCCNDACTGTCEACDGAATKGTCAAVVGVARHGSCPAPSGGDPCSGGSCDGKTRTSCAGYPGSEIICQVGSCTGGIEVPVGRCDGAGACQALAPRKCDPYVCDGKACVSKCTDDSSCVAGNRCDSASGKCVSASTCIDAQTLVGPTGTKTPCSPYACQGSACRGDCGSTQDCAAGFTCDTALHTCVAPASTEDSGGCAMATRAEGVSSGAVVLASLLVAAASRRQRRARRGSATNPCGER